MNPFAQIWAVDNGTYALLHQQTNDYQFGSASNKQIYWYDMEEGKKNQGTIVLEKASNFIDDVKTIHHVSQVKDTSVFWATYIHKQEAGLNYVASCKLTKTESDTIEIKDKSDCTRYEFDTATAKKKWNHLRVFYDQNLEKYRVMGVSNEELPYVLRSYSVTICTIDLDTKSIINCIESQNSLIVNGENFLRVEMDH